ncbi:MAG: hypothetical protein ACLGI9_09105, partial [Thermoanaerobaculia bacterium]
SIGPSHPSGGYLKIRLAVCCLFAVLAVPSAGLEPYLVKDVNPVPTPAGSGPAAFAALGNRAVFEAQDGVSDRVLWTSDGTSEGTRVLLDACPGCTDAVEALARTEDRLFFLAYGEPGRKSLWVTDGTSAQRLSGPLAVERESAWVAAQRVLYFAAEGGLWRTDGTPGGTRLVLDSPVSQLTAFRGRVWFVRGRALWQSDGTPEGTSLVRRFSREPRILGGVGKHVVLAAGDELWSTGGIVARGLQVLDAVVQAGRLWLVAETRRGQELWVSDGTAARQLTGLSRKRAFFDPDRGMYLGLPRSGLGGRLVFAVHDGVHGAEPWVSDGTPAGTRLLRDLCPGPCAGVDALGLVHHGRLYFTGTDGALGRELWSTDGLRVDLVRDVCAGPCDSDPGSLVGLGDGMLFAAADGVNGTELWSSEGRLTDFEPEVPWGRSMAPSCRASSCSAPTTASMGWSSGRPTAPPRGSCGTWTAPTAAAPSPRGSRPSEAPPSSSPTTGSTATSSGRATAPRPARSSSPSWSPGRSLPSRPSCTPPRSWGASCSSPWRAASGRPTARPSQRWRTSTLARWSFSRGASTSRPMGSGAARTGSPARRTPTS